MNRDNQKKYKNTSGIARKVLWPKRARNHTVNPGGFVDKRI